MKNHILIIIVLITISNIGAQAPAKGDMYIGGFFTFLSDAETLSALNDEFTLYSYFFNTNLAYQLSNRWRLGMELMIIQLQGGDATDQFYLTGLSTDYALLRADKFAWYLRGGVSLSNLSYAGDVAPTTRFVINRIIGTSFEFELAKRFWLTVGYYNHFPLNNIRFKYGLVNPHIGFKFRFNK